MRRRRDFWILLGFLGGWSLAGMTTAGATPPLERKAKALGLPATDCTYCHAFSMERMNKKALETRVAPMDCVACHGRQLPRRGSALFNERGRWLLAERARRQVKEVDLGWQGVRAFARAGFGRAALSLRPGGPGIRT